MKHIKQKISKRAGAITCLVVFTVMSTLIIPFLMPLLVPSISEAASAISIDGNFSDWENIPKLASNSSDIKNWAVQKDSTNIYFYVHELSGNQYDHTTQTISVNYSIGSNNEKTGWGKYDGIVLPGSLVSVEDKNWSDVTGSAISYSKDPSEGYDVEFSVPIAYFNAVDPNFSFSYVGSKIAAAEIPVVNAGDTGNTGTTGGATDPGTTTGEATRPAYSGIKIDGKFDDWAFKDTTVINDSHVKGLKTVWDGEYLYVYLDEDSNSYDGNIGNAGAKGNGQLAIVTDNNRKTTFFVKYNNGKPYLAFDDSGKTIINGSTGAYNTHRYEFKIPIEQIKDINYTNSLAFAIYGSGTTDTTQILESGISDISGKHTSIKNTGNITMDGNYSDWNGFEVQDIDYSTSGGKGPDGVGSLFFDHDVNMIYGHTYGKAQNKSTGKYNNDITPFSIFVNGNDNGVMLTAVEVSDNGKIIKSDDGQINAGTKHYYLVDVSSPISMGNTKIDSSTMNGYVYGEIWITAGNQNYEGKNVEAEFELYSKAIQDHYKLEEHSLRSVQARFQDLGNQKLTTQGASSGPIIGIILSLITIAIGYLYVQRKREKSQLEVTVSTPEKKK